MEREILFRGQRFSGLNEPYSNEWVEGFYYQLGLQHYIRKDIHVWEVDHKTVGQFTGLKDKNGKKIFEGDIVVPCLTRQFGSVIFMDGMFCFTVDQFHSELKPLCISISMARKANNPYEVIGNIHDNPELLK